MTTPDLAEAVERARAADASHLATFDAHGVVADADPSIRVRRSDLRLILDTLAAAQARVEELEGALEPFAQAASLAQGLDPEVAVSFYPCTVADLRRAAALTRSREDG